MIKISKPFRYAKLVKINSSIIRDVNFLNMIKNDLKKLRRLLKNTLRIKLISIEIDYHKDDFAMDRKTMLAKFEIITFKRK